MARTVAVTPNLRYIDLPEGIFQDDVSCNTLKQEIQGRCPDLRKMTYMRGSERSLELLAGGRLWRNLEVLELSKLTIDSTILRHALGSLPNLHALKVTDMVFHDQFLEHNDRLPPFPPLKEMIFKNVSNITADGISNYLFRSVTQDALETLSLENTGVHPYTLQQILSTAPNLKHLTIIDTVSTSFPVGNNIQPLSSASLETLHYEVSSSTEPNIYTGTIDGYYAYLTSSLISNLLPSLHELYVRNPDFPETLVDLAPPAPAFVSDPDNFVPGPKSPASLRSPNSFMPNNRFSSNNPFAPSLNNTATASPGLKKPLVVYSKGLDEEEWNFSRVKPAAQHGRRGSASAPRPVSSYGLGSGLASPWTTKGARQSVIVGNGFGGFLAIPAEDGPRPSSSAGEKGHKRVGSTTSQYDMWR